MNQYKSVYLQIIDPLPPIDHDTINYDKFEKNFYEEHAEIKKLTPAEVEDLKKHLDMKVFINKHKWKNI